MKLTLICHFAPSYLLVKVKSVSHSKQELEESSSIHPPPPPPLCRKELLLLMARVAVVAVVLPECARLPRDTVEKHKRHVLTHRTDQLTAATS